MKKTLLVLPIIAFTIFAKAQNTYIGDQMPVKVMSNTLFFHGGDFTIKNTEATPSALTQVVINDGNIKVNGDFKNNLANSDGKHFINTYTSPTSYGQLIIAGDKTVSGKIAMEKSGFKTVNDYSVIGLPFVNDNSESIKDIINNMVGSNDAFVGYCPVNQTCADRYKQTILLWDIAQTEYDAVLKTDKVLPGRSYTIKLNNGSIRDFANSNPTKFPIYGTPNNTEFTFDAKSGTRHTTTDAEFETFSNSTWSEWKDRLNNYAESFVSYLGDYNNTQGNKLYGKNLHRFSNPYTSNLDLSDVSSTNTWIKFKTKNGTDLTPTAAYAATIRFKVSKLPSDYIINWQSGVGTTNTQGTEGKRISAYLYQNNNANTYFWEGNPDALLVKPYEYFELEYYTIGTSANGDRIVRASYEINDNNKTFEDTPKYDERNTGVFSRNINSNSTNTSNLEQRGFIAPNDFTQVELNLLKDNYLIGDAAYLVNGDFYRTGIATAERRIENPIYLLEETAEGTVVNNAQTLLNQFNSLDYVGKPLGISFNNLTNGEEYNIRLRLFEHSILNRVNNFTSGRYYLLDKQINQVTEVDANTQITFIADENTNTRFELYWNEQPRTLATDDLIKTNKTFVYSNEKQKFVRFEKDNTTANIEIFDLTGRLITSNKNISTTNDYKLNLTNLPNVYVVVITYEDGKVVSEKILNK